ncbi:unnamed protein product [Adineta ricciae]|uniref:EF-hand domain-containing protein n=1 Tax=Adineta ricciae TaxID=249248 RepID=A0A813X117_ADIRI|nr:unnamed protein product [Adineta ricciae]
MTNFNDLPIEIVRLIFEYFTSAEIVHIFSPINPKMKAIAYYMFLNIDYAKRAAAREKNSKNTESLAITQIEDDDIDYEQLFDNPEVIFEKPKSEATVKTKKRVRFAPMAGEDTPTPTLPRPPSIRPTFDIEFDFDSLESPSIERTNGISQMPAKSNDSDNWKNAFLSDLHIAKKSKPTILSSPSIAQVESKTTEDTLWDFMKESNPELLEKLERTNNDKQNRLDRFATQQPTSMNNTTAKIVKTLPEPDNEQASKSVPLPEYSLKQQPEPLNLSLVEIRLEYDEFNQTHEELLLFLLPYHKILCQEKLWPQDFHLNENLDQERGKPLFDLLTKTHEKFENILHPKILHIKNMFMDFFNKRRQLNIMTRQIFEPKFLLLVQYESVDLLHDIEYGLSSIIELHPYVYDKRNSINRDELNDLFMYHNMLIIRTRQISPEVILRPKRLTLVIEYEYGEQILQWCRLCQQQNIPYIAYKTILPTFIPSGGYFRKKDNIHFKELYLEKEEIIEVKDKIFSPTTKEDPLTLPTIVLARPLVDNFKLLRTLECRHDISIITRDYHLLNIPIDQQPDILIDWSTSMLIFDLNTKLDIDHVRQKIQSMTHHSCHIHIAILTSGSIPDFILSTYITPITQLAKQIQENESNIDIQIKSFGSLDDFANHVAQLVQQERTIKCLLTPTPSWNEKLLLRRCSSLNSISAQLILQRVKNIDLSLVSLDVLISQCSEIPTTYLKHKPIGLSIQQMEELRGAFNLFDRDRNGAISLAELKQVLIALNFQPTEKLLGKIMKEMDTDGNGSVEFDEFVKVMRKVYERNFTDEEMRKAFACFDVDNSGYITVNELREVLGRLNHNVTEYRINEVLGEIDTDHDGKISFDEFARMLKHM